jgi:dTDP-glucose 4,6-dehydratase
MRLLVTGGAGFIGSNFIHYWFAKHPKDEIINVDNLTYAANLSNLDGVGKYEYEFVKDSICNAKVMDGLVKDVDAIVNFAAETHVDNSIISSESFIRANINGVHTLLEAAKKHEKRFHQISTDEVYGSLPFESQRKFNEKSPYLPRNPYSATKASADHLVRAYYNTFKMKATISTCCNNFGPRQHIEKLMPKTIINALNFQPVPIYGNGKNIRDWIYVEDHCSAIEAIIKNGTYGETYSVSSNNELSNLQVVRGILKHLNRSEALMRFVADRPGHDLRYALDSGKIKRELGWKPKFNFDRGLELTIKYYIDMHDTKPGTKS